MNLIYIENEITDASISELCYYLGNSGYGETIKIFINSSGGSINSLRTVSDIALAQNLTLHTVCVGQTWSAALSLFMLGDIREMLDGSILIAHECTYSTGSNSNFDVHDIQIGLQELHAIREFFFRELLKKTKISAELLNEKIHKTDWTILREEAIELGIVTVY